MIVCVEASATCSADQVTTLCWSAGGSIQNPAGSQSLVGVKTTFGIIPVRAVQLAARTVCVHALL